ncbi:MAG: efflux transporter outer membrane subunit [Nevskia sp.]|nr:efflux transporter outer membrane subunit [Nevskia sp.]
MNLRPALLAMSALLLQACAGMGGIAPQSRQLDPRGLDPGAALSAPQADAGWPQPGWWKAYGDPQLDALVDTALAGNPDLRIAQARVRQAAGQSAAAGAATLPEVDGSAGFIRTLQTREEFSPSLIGAYAYWDNSALLKASFDLDLWGKNRATAEGALDAQQAAEVNVRAAGLTLAAAAVQGYVQLDAQYALRDVAQANLERQQQVLDIARRRYAAGLGTELEVTEAATVLPETQAQLEQIDEAIALQRHQLAALAGEGPGDGDRLARPALHDGAAVDLPAAIPAGLVGRRPDIVAQRWAVEAAGKDIAVARARFYPDVNLVAFAGLEGLSFDRFFQNSATTYGAGPALTLPVFEGGRLRGNLQAQTAAYDIAVETYNRTVIAALQQVSDQIASLRSLQTQLQRTDEALALAQQAYHQAELGFRAGLSDYLSVLNTQGELLAQQRSRAQIEARRLAAHTALMQALGGGFDDTAADATAGGQP